MLVAVSLSVPVYEYWISPRASLDRDVLFQTSTIDALLVGVYDGDLTLKQLQEHGDTGIGTFNDLDGEMIGLDGKFYQVRVDGAAYLVNDSMLTPFAEVTFFEPDMTATSDEPLNYTQLEAYLDRLLPTKNLFYVIKIKGLFEYVKTRSVPRQVKPYPPLQKAVQSQSIFEFHKIEGTVIGVRAPEFMGGLSVPGYHFHFITKDRKAGGHLLDCNTQSVTMEIDHTQEFHMILLGNEGFYRTNLSGEEKKELGPVEKQPR